MKFLGLGNGERGAPSFRAITHMIRIRVCTHTFKGKKINAMHDWVKNETENGHKNKKLSKYFQNEQQWINHENSNHVVTW